MQNNFVDVVGYQFEKVHTGVLACLLDSERSRLRLDEQSALATKLAPRLLPGVQLAAIKSTREYSFGRRLRIDLVVELQAKVGPIPSAYILIECKTDSDVSVEQLQDSEKAFAADKPNAPFSVIVLAVGAGQHTLKHQLKAIRENGHEALGLEDALHYFADLSIAGKDKIYDDWFAALEAECDRAAQIDLALASAENPWDPRLSKTGYRTGFPVFYMYYDKLRARLEVSPFKDWAIYSGRNNPVMNWQKVWFPAKDNEIQLYWEFNWSAFCLKAQIEAATTARWNKLRPSLIDLCSSCPIAGRKTANRSGMSVTAYKWEFDFCKDTPTTIAQKTADILSHVHERLHCVA